ncbi:MAG: hypothetical protein ACE5JG_10295, partial [Planctomycetota bacterium]
MRSWLYLLTIAVAVYFVYRNWIAVEDPDPQQEAGPATKVDAAPDPSAESPPRPDQGEPSPAPRSLHLDAAEGGAPPPASGPDPAQELWRRRTDALDAGDADAAGVASSRPPGGE